MPAFQAINLEPEENIDEQIDTTKELHVDDALKRFHHALKLHAQGPRSREAAGLAYEDLLRSEIFGYREACTEYDRAERQADGRPDVQTLGSFSAGLDVDAGGADGVSASLSQALYLSYKNYGQYFLEKLRDAQNSDSEWARRGRILYTHEEGKRIIDNWTAALDQDPSDPELWRKAARVAASMDSGRLNRYCLEAAIELDDDPAIEEVEPSCLSESLAGEQLKNYLQAMGDDIALTHPIIAPWLRKIMPAFIKHRLDPMPFLPDLSTCSVPPPPPAPLLDSRMLECSLSKFASGSESVAGSSKTISSWAELGLELIACIEDTAGALRACRSTTSELTTGESSSPVDQEKATLNDKASSSQANTGSRESSVKGDVVGVKTNAKNKDRGAPIQSADSKKTAETSQKERRASISARKRSQSAAGIQEGTDEENAGEKRSKRIRRRETILTEVQTDPSTLAAKQLEPLQTADQALFEMTQTILETVGAEDQSALDDVKEALDSCHGDDRTSRFTTLAAKDLRDIILKYDDETARVLLDKNERPALSLSSFLEHAKPGIQDQLSIPAFNETSGLRNFAERIEQCCTWMTSPDIAFEWVSALSKSYATSRWSDTMKTAVIQVLNCVDTIIYGRVTEELELAAEFPQKLAGLETLVPMVFELHIDIYERITNPSSAVDYATRTETRYRLERWLDVASAYVQLIEKPLQNPLFPRFFWAATLASSLAEQPVREHILLMWTSVRDFLVKNEFEPINLPNNVVMPVLSPAAADREISKLTTMDFFLSLFQPETESPVQVIETLEPVLNPSSVCVVAQGPKSTSDESGELSSLDRDDAQHIPVSQCANQGLSDLWKFLQGSSTELRLFLWSRLGDAYLSIGYTTKKFSCALKSIQLIESDLRSEVYIKTPDESRRLLFIRTLKSLDEVVIQALSLALNDRSAFEIIDEEHIRSTCDALARASSFLHVALISDDEFRFGVTSQPCNNSTFQAMMSKLKDMQVRNLCLQYRLFKASFELRESAADHEQELADFLITVHRAIGMRKACRSSNKIFLKLMMSEILKFKNLERWEDYLGQVLYDLYSLKLGSEPAGLQDHGCPHELLGKRQTLQLTGRIMTLANRLPMKDLLKSDLKNTIDHMQQTIGQTKSTPQMIHNLRNFTELLKKPIHPLRLYQALAGNVCVDAVSVNLPETTLAENGWFYLLGMIVLTKFKGVDLNRRQTPGAIDDLRIGATFLRLQLQFTADRWDAWFRLGECFDYELDEAVLWTADKMNKERGELIKFQRNAIHCYTLALSHSRHKRVDTLDGDPLYDLYYEFGLRLYSSSREPFKMEPFQHSDQERFFIESIGAGTFKRVIHEQMSAYNVWKFAAKLFRMAMERKPEDWKTPYMLAKCYWKMYQTQGEKLDSKDQRSRVSIASLVNVLKIATKLSYSRRKSRSSEPILEPHYKILSVLHKLVKRGDMPAAEAASILSEQPFGVKLDKDVGVAALTELEAWSDYIIRNLTVLKEKDKSNWHHRMIMRHARIVFDEEKAAGDNAKLEMAKDAFTVLRHSLFTKTMVMNVWKCDAERPGRHHFYTEQYMRFMTKLLVILDDRANLELLLRRLRRKGADFYHFTELWQVCCTEYARLLRRAHSIPDDVEEVFKSMSSDEFEVVGERIADWASGGGSEVAAFSCMKEAIELKKLNAALMKVSIIDDLITDSYSVLYRELTDKVSGLDPSKIKDESNLRKEGTPRPEALTETEVKPSSSLNNLLNPADGPTSTTRATTPQEAEKPEAAPRARRVGVRRPDILRKAEQAVVSSMEASKPATAKGPVAGVSGGKRGSQTPNPAASDAGSAGEGPETQVQIEAGQDAGTDMQDEGEDDGGGKGHSNAGSLHDSADESDLSDVPEDYEEEIPPSLRFPNIESVEARDETSGGEADSEDEGDEDEEAGKQDEVDEAHARDDKGSTTTGAKEGEELQPQPLPQQQDNVEDTNRTGGVKAEIAVEDFEEQGDQTHEDEMDCDMVPANAGGSEASLGK